MISVWLKIILPWNAYYKEAPHRLWSFGQKNDSIWVQCEASGYAHAHENKTEIMFLLGIKTTLEINAP